MTQHTIQPLRPDRTKYPPVPYVPVLAHFGVAPRVDWQGQAREVWAIYHHSGMVIGSGGFPSKEMAIKALFRLQQSAEFQQLARLSKAYPNSDAFLGFNPTVLLEQIQELNESIF